MSPILMRWMTSATGIAMWQIAAAVVRDQVGRPVGLQKLRDANNAGLAKLGEHAPLFQKALQSVFVCVAIVLGGEMQGGAVGAAKGEPRGKVLLDGHAPLEAAVVGAIGDAEAARAEHRSNLETVDLCPGGKRQLVVRHHRLMGTVEGGLWRLWGVLLASFPAVTVGSFSHLASLGAYNFSRFQGGCERPWDAGKCGRRHI